MSVIFLLTVVKAPSLEKTKGMIGIKNSKKINIEVYSFVILFTSGRRDAAQTLGFDKESRGQAFPARLLHTKSGLLVCPWHSAKPDFLLLP